MKVNKLFGLTMAVFAGICLFCSSCTREESTLPRGEEEEEVPADYVKMVFNVKDATKPESYAAGDTENDSSIGDDLMVLILLQNQEFNKDDLWHYDRARKMTKTLKGSYSVLLPSTLAGKTFKMFVCANASSILGDNPDKTLMERKEGFAYETGLSEADIITKLTFDINANANAPHWAPKSLPMWGKSEGNSFTMADLGKEYKLKPVKLLRALIRVDVGLGYAAGATVDDPPLGLGNFKITKIHVARTLNKAQFIPTVGNYDYDQTTSDTDALNNPYTVTKISLPADAPFNTDALFEVPADDGKDGKSCIQKIYIPEQANPGGEDNFAKRPCVIVEGDYQPVEGATEAIHGFYRLDFKTTVSGADDFEDILRGNLMRMNITAVKGPGLKTVEEALKSRPLNVDVTVTSYNLLTENTVIDGQYSFSAAKKEVVMPREPGVTYKLRVVTDIPESEWTATFEKPTPAFEVTKEKVAGSKDEYTLKIKTKKAWAATDGENNLLITGKRLKMVIPVRQVDQSTADWLDGGSEDSTLGGDLSTSVLYFTGIGGVQEFSVGGIYQPITIEDVPEWLKVEQVANVNKITVEVSMNSGVTGVRTATILLQKGEIEYKLNVVQSILVLANVEDVSRGVLWRDRNEGSVTADYRDTNSFDFLKSYYENSGNKVCPLGWIVPSMADYKSLLVNNAAVENNVYSYGESGRDAYLMVSDRFNRIYFPTKEATNLDEMRYWTSDGYFVSMTTATSGGKTKVTDVIKSSYQALGSVRCIRKFKLEKSEIILNMAGEEAYVDFSTIRDAESFTYTVGGLAADLTVRSGGTNRIIIGRKKPNMTGSNREVSVTFIGSNVKNPQLLKVIQQGGTPLADEMNPVRIGNLEWYYKNEYATCGGNGFVYYSDITERISVSKDSLAAPQGTVITGDPGVFGRRMPYKEAAKACYNITTDGGGWRLPTLLEWDELYKRLRVAEGKYTGGQSAVANNDEFYPIYLATDGNHLLYLPVGFVTPGGNGEAINMRLSRYATGTETGGSTVDMISFNRLLWKPDTGIPNKHPVDVPITEGGLVSRAGDNTGFLNYVRCVRTVKSK